MIAHRTQAVWVRSGGSVPPGMPCSPQHGAHGQLSKLSTPKEEENPGSLLQVFSWEQERWSRGQVTTVPSCPPWGTEQGQEALGSWELENQDNKQSYALPTWLLQDSPSPQVAPGMNFASALPFSPPECENEWKLANGLSDLSSAVTPVGDLDPWLRYTVAFTEN